MEDKTIRVQFLCKLDGDDFVRLCEKTELDGLVGVHGCEKVKVIMAFEFLEMADGERVLTISETLSF